MPGQSANSNVADLVLVVMPYAAVERPALGASILAASARKSGIRTHVEYANISFAASVGLEEYNRLGVERSAELVGEWSFSEAAFGYGVSSAEEFATRFYPHVSEGPARERVVEVLRLTQSRANEFVPTLADAVLRRNPKIVGCTSTFQQHCASIALLKEVKKRDSSVVTILGGANCEGPMGQSLIDSFDWIDFAWSGPADHTFSEFCNSIIHQTATGLELLTTRQVLQDTGLPLGEGRTAPRMDDIAEPHFCDYFQCLRESQIADDVEPGLPIELSRGCWWGAKHHCTFCGLNGQSMAYRKKSPERAIEESVGLAERSQITRFELVDNIIDRTHITDVLPEVKRQLPSATFFCEVKANLCREDLINLVSSGARWLQPGIESLDDGLLRLMRKGTTGALNIRLLRWARELGVRLSWSLLFGFPGEDTNAYEKMAAIVPKLFHLQPPSGASALRFDRFSPYFENADEYGLDLTPAPGYEFVYPLNVEQRSRLAYFFVDNGRPAYHPAYALLEDAVRRWNKAFWSRDRPIVAIAEDPDGSVIVDTRTGTQRMVISPITRSILDICAEPATVEKVLERTRLLNRGSTEADVVQSFEDVVARDWVVQLGKSVISVVVPVDGANSLGRSDPHPRLLAWWEFPGGTSDLRVLREVSDVERW